MNRSELIILGAYLNVNRLPPFKADVPWFVAHHFARVASGNKIHSIVIGGLVTHLARSLFGFDGTGGHGPETKEVPLFDSDHMIKQQHWVKRVNSTTFTWLVKTEGRDKQWLQMPTTILPPMAPNPPLRDGEPYEKPSYLISVPTGQASERGEPSETPARPRHSRFPPSRTSVPLSVSPVRRASPAPEGSFFIHEEAPSTAPHVHSDPTFSMGDHSSYYPIPQYDPNSFENRRHCHEAVNTGMGTYRWIEHMESLGLHKPEDPAPTFYQGLGNYPGTLFEEYGIDRRAWGPTYGQSYGGAGGQFLPGGSQYGDGSIYSQAGYDPHVYSSGFYGGNYGSSYVDPSNVEGPSGHHNDGGDDDADAGEG